MNTYWRRNGSIFFISKQGQAFREAVIAVVQDIGVETMTGRVGLSLVAYPPDRRRRDLDNLLKGIMDGLQHAGLYADDCQVDDLRISRGNIVPDGLIDVIAHELTAGDDEQLHQPL